MALQKRSNSSSSQQYSFCISNTGDHGFPISELLYTAAMVYTMRGHSLGAPQILEPAPHFTVRELLHMKLWWCTWWYPIWTWFSVWGKLKRWVRHGARGAWAPEHWVLGFEGSGLWNAKTRWSCCTGQGWMAQEDVPSSVKEAILRGRTGK